MNLWILILNPVANNQMLELCRYQFLVVAALPPERVYSRPTVVSTGNRRPVARSSDGDSLRSALDKY